MHSSDARQTTKRVIARAYGITHHHRCTPCAMGAAHGLSSPIRADTRTRSASLKSFLWFPPRSASMHPINLAPKPRLASGWTFRPREPRNSSGHWRIKLISRPRRWDLTRSAIAGYFRWMNSISVTKIASATVACAVEFTEGYLLLCFALERVSWREILFLLATRLRKTVLSFLSDGSVCLLSLSLFLSLEINISASLQQPQKSLFLSFANKRSCLPWFSINEADTLPVTLVSPVTPDALLTNAQIEVCTHVAESPTGTEASELSASDFNFHLRLFSIIFALSIFANPRSRLVAIATAEFSTMLEFNKAKCSICHRRENSLKTSSAAFRVSHCRRISRKVLD